MKNIRWVFVIDTMMGMTLRRPDYPWPEGRPREMSMFDGFMKPIRQWKRESR